jgi:hypothetical protein
MARDNPSWREERIANELSLNTGIQISLRTVRKYMPKCPWGQPRGDQRGPTFVGNYAKAIVACDFLTVVTATFKTLCMLGDHRARNTKTVTHQCHGSSHSGLNMVTASALAISYDSLDDVD